MNLETTYLEVNNNCYGGTTLTFNIQLFITVNDQLSTKDSINHSVQIKAQTLGKTFLKTHWSE